MSSRVLNGRYRLDETIGSGTTATVWRAWDRRYDRAVAVKILDGSELGRDDEQRARFHDEARTLAGLSHPNIVGLWDSGSENGVAYVVMELVDGPSVVGRLADGAMSVAEAAAVMGQVCDALAAAHAAGVVHGGIKPGNILLTGDQTVKVTDFGISRLLDTAALTAYYVAPGTISYMSPEQVAGLPLDGRADLYAVGCVLFRMLTGTTPFAGEEAFDIACEQLCDEPPTIRARRPELPGDLDRLVDQLLAKDPALRPASAAEVQAELIRWSAPETAADPVEPPRRRRPLVRLGVATMAAIVVPAALVLAWPDQELVQPPAAAFSPSPSTTAPESASPTPSLGPAQIAWESATSAPSQQSSPKPSPSPSPRSASDQILDLRTLISRPDPTWLLQPKNGDALDHLLDDLSRLVAEGKRPEAEDKLAAIQKKNDDLLAAGKISPTGHAAIAGGLDQLAVAISSLPAA
ncbi:serine/threonine-protein kinase [Hamadaea sp. NPDC051192]|uniref:serine/threonine-protein kinase n=1 Tax=Hamadaea sp. NPDC051192 TaxID=3154940 RepID=UPI00343B04FC